MKNWLWIFCLLTIPSYAAKIDSTSPRDIYADEIFFDANTNSAQGIGNARVKNTNGQSMSADFMSLTNKDSDIILMNSEIFLGPSVRVSASALTADSREITADRMTYTACYGCDALLAWEFHADEMVNNREKQTMEFYDATLYWHGLPVVWLPYFSNPDPSVKRRSGIMMPKMGTTNNFGYTIELPVYVAVSDYHDFTLTPTYFSNARPLVKGEHRLNADHSEFRTAGSFTQTNRARWHIFNYERMELGENMLAKVSVNRTSDKYYLREYEFYDSQPYLDTFGKLEMFGESGFAYAETHSFQELRLAGLNDRGANGDILPRLHGWMQTDPIIGRSFLNLEADFMNLNKSQDARNTIRATGEMKYIQPFIIPFGQKLEFSLRGRYDVYQFSDASLLDGTPNYSGTKGRFIPSGHILASWPLVNYKWGVAQTLEPKAEINFMPKTQSRNFINQDSTGSLLTDASIFGDNRYVGYDLVNNGTYADYGVAWNLTDNQNRSIETFLGQSYDFYEMNELDPNSGFHYGASDIVARITAKPYKNIASINRARFSKNDGALRHLESDVRVGVKDYVSLGFMHAVQFDENVMLDRQFDEIRMGLGMGLSDRLRLTYGLIYNITDDRLQTRNVGMKYEHPCYGIEFLFGDDRAQAYDGRQIGMVSFRMHFSLKIQGSK
jgi:LPS-assembly protein